jgi:hypothetical protein
VEASFDLGAKFDFVTTGELDDRFDALRKDLKHKPEKPFYNSGIAAGLIPVGNAPLMLDCGSPNTGRIWNVTGLTLLGADDSTVLANAKAALYFGDTDTPSISTCKVPGQAIPSFSTFSDKVLWCHSTANAVVVVTGTATALSQVIAMVHYTDYPEEFVSGNSGR